MGKFLNSIYRKYENPGFRKYLSLLNLKPSCVIEAGCHDATDTIKINQYLEPKFYLAFEPDTQAFLKAKKTIENIAPNICLFSTGLGRENSEVNFFTNTDNPGDGTSGINLQVSSDNGLYVESSIEIQTLDSFFKSCESRFEDEDHRNVFLWLDVEGFEHDVLLGATKTLEKVCIAQIEVNMHNSIRLATSQKVDQLMKKNGFLILYAPLQPGYFGDVVYAHKSVIMSHAVRIKASILRIFFTLLHCFVYPILNKPGGM